MFEFDNVFNKDALVPVLEHSFVADVVLVKVLVQFGSHDV